MNNLENLNIKDLLSDELKNDLDSVLSQTESLMGDWDYDNDTMSVKLKVSFMNKSDNPDPSYEKEGDSGFDIRSNMNEEVNINPGDRVLIKTGLHFEIPLGYELQVRSRSGLALKNGIMVLNSPGTVDSGYRGEIGVILYNSDRDKVFTVNKGDRIAQGVISAVQTIGKTKFIKKDRLSNSDRGNGGFGGGFGSTGII